jgi:hypothetical protein
MAGCETKNLTLDHDHGVGTVLTWVWGGAGLGGVLGFLNLADALGAAVSGGTALVALAAIVVAAAAGAALGFAIGWAVEWFDRLKAQDPSQITICGLIVCAGKNTGLPPFNDNDWTFNMCADFKVEAPVLPGLDTTAVRFRAAPDSGQAVAAVIVDPNNGDVQVFHCEIGSHVGDYAAVGGAIGAVAGAIGGAIAGAAICVALGLLTFGIGLALCALIVAAAILIATAAGYFAGDLIGSGIGWIADQIDDFDQRGKEISQGAIMALTGAWVTDTNHQHNEIHDIKSAVVCDLMKQSDCAAASSSSAITIMGVVGIGRHPSGPDP